jgi:glyoxylase-like metal-dependent hydrolase (beta-lactamase superfamily II)
MPSSQVTRIHRSVWYAGGASCFYLADHVLIDSGGSQDMDAALRLFDEARLKIEELQAIVLTHFHRDHAGCALQIRALSDAPIYCLKKEERTSAWQRFLSADGLEAHLTYVQPQDTLPYLGGMQVIPTPGHTSNHLSLFSGRYGILFSGDALQVKNSCLTAAPSWFNEDSLAAQESYRLLIDLPWSLLCPGHREPILRSTVDASLRMQYLARLLSPSPSPSGQ